MYPKYILGGEVISTDDKPRLLINWKDTLPLEPESLMFVEYIRRVRTKKQIIHWLATDGKVASTGKLLRWFATLISAPAMISISDDNDWQSFEGFTLMTTESYEPTKYPLIQQVLNLQDNIEDSEDTTFAWEVDASLEEFLVELDAGIASEDVLLRPTEVGRPQYRRRSFPGK